MRSTTARRKRHASLPLRPPSNGTTATISWCPPGAPTARSLWITRSPLLQADAEFLKLQARTTLYGSIANGRGAIGVRLGAIHPLGPDSDLPANLQIPLNTRFFAGGANTHRAFERDYLGIPDQTINFEGDPIGRPP